MISFVQNGEYWFFQYGFYMIGNPQNMYIIAENSVIYNNKVFINA